MFKAFVMKVKAAFAKFQAAAKAELEFMLVSDLQCEAMVAGKTLKQMMLAKVAA